VGRTSGVFGEKHLRTIPHISPNDLFLLLLRRTDSQFSAGQGPLKETSYLIIVLLAVVFATFALYPQTPSVPLTDQEKRGKRTEEQRYWQ
jgi:hypothetical protein